MRKLCVILCVLLLPALILAQGVTTAAFSGRVTDADGNPLVGVTIVAIHNPTGTIFNGVSRTDGYFNIPAVKVGGPYTVSAIFEGFKRQDIKDIILRLGEDRSLNFRMILETIQEEIMVSAPNPVISQNRTGAAQNVTTAVIESLPSLGRTFGDFARLSPQVDSGGGGFNAAGRNNRYNNIQIDGAVNNDLFGLSSTGTPGVSAPISLDAVQEFQIVIAPYDVRQGGFTGGGLNAITRSGTNDFNASLFFFGRNQEFVGDGPDQAAYTDFKDIQYGFRLGGPIIKDKMFFFVNGEIGTRSNPATYVIDDSGNFNDFGGANVSVADAQRFRDILINQYGYDPGGFGAGYMTQEANNSKLFIRVDYNINAKNRLTFRHNYVNGLMDNNPSKASSYVFPFADVFYRLKSKTNSTVVQLNSTLSKNLFNELTLNYTTVRDFREIPNADDPFPQVNVTVSGLYKLTAGTEQYSAANGLDQDIIEITDNVTWFKGKHTFVLGTHNEIFKFSNLYIRNLYGYWEFSSLSNFEIGKPSRYYHDFITADPAEMWQPEFWVKQLGAYVGDTWAVLPNLNLTLGARVDVPIITDIPTANPNTVAVFDIKTDQVASGNLLFSPRVGFNWDVNKDKKTQVRGGIGIFSGRTPYVWISNQYSNTGMEFTRLDIRNPSFSFVTDPFNQPMGGTGLTSEVDLIDDNFKYPQVLRTNLALDRELPWGIVGTVEFLYTKNLNEILYQNLNIRETGAMGAGNRIMYKRDVSSLFTDVIYLTNTKQGYQYNISVQLQKNFKENSWINLSYTYGQAKDVNSGTSSQASSNFGYNPIRYDPNDPELTWSNFDVRHRLAAAISYTLKLIRKAPTTLGLFYGARSGLPYSTTYNYSDVNGDGASGNDLVFVPTSLDELIIYDGAYPVSKPYTDQNAAWELLNTFINEDPALAAARGTIIERNASRTPWYHGVDARIAQDIPIPGLKGNRLQVTLDIQNVLNLLNHEWGKSWYVSNQNDTPWAYNGIDAATGKAKITFIPRSTHFALSQLGSRWQVQLGLRYTY